MSDTNKEVEKEEDIEEQISDIINELKGFQGILDSKNIKLSKKNLRVWAGHINFCVTVVIEEFQKLKVIITKFLSTIDKNEDKDEDIYI